MAQEPSIEAARTRIQRLVDEIVALTKRDIRSEEYFQEYLTRVVQACDAKGGGVWLVGQRRKAMGRVLPDRGVGPHSRERIGATKGGSAPKQA